MIVGRFTRALFGEPHARAVFISRRDSRQLRLCPRGERRPRVMGKRQKPSQTGRLPADVFCRLFRRRFVPANRSVPFYAIPFRLARFCWTDKRSTNNIESHGYDPPIRVKQRARVVTIRPTGPCPPPLRWITLANARSRSPCTANMWRAARTYDDIYI